MIFTTPLKNASGSYNRSMRLPAQTTSNFPKSWVNLQASPYKNFTLFTRSLYFYDKIEFADSMNFFEQSTPITQVKQDASQIAVLPTAQPISKALPVIFCSDAAVITFLAQVAGKFLAPKY